METTGTKVLKKHEFRTLTDLPYEVLEQLLSYTDITYVDVCRVAQVGQKLVGIVNSNELWRRKFLQTWKQLYKLYKKRDVEWKQEFRERHKFEKIVTDSISRMRGLYLLSNQAQNYTLAEFRSYFDGHRFSSYFLTDTLECRIHDGSNNTNLTNKYYCRKLLHFVRQEHLLRLLQQHLKEADYSHAEIGAYLIAHFCQPNLRLNQETISSQLDDIALKVRAELRESSPEHPALSKDIIPPSVSLDGTLWTVNEGLMVLRAINIVLFEDLKFRCMSICDLSTDYIFINQVLETKVGTPVVLSIIYTAVAHRLGVRCIHTTKDSGILKCLESPGLDDTKDFVCVTVAKDGIISTVHLNIPNDEVFSSRLLENSPLLPVQSMIELIEDYSTVLRRVGDQQLLSFYESCALELHACLSPDSALRKTAYIEDLLAHDTKLFDVLDLLEQFKQCEDAPQHLHTYERLYKRAKIQIDGILSEFDRQDLLEELRQKKWFRKNCNVSYAVGMIMVNRSSNKICVIDGWERRQTRNRAVYHVLSEDGKQGYLPEEFLIIHDKPQPVEHPDVGKFFEEFTGTHYVPNEVKAAEYPEDVAALDAILEVYFAQLKKASSTS